MKIISEKKGIILVDILLALSLAVFFTAIIAESSFGAGEIFNSAKSRNSILNLFENDSSSEIIMKSQPYGNDMVENYSDLNGVFFASFEPNTNSNFSEFAGVPFCSVDFTDNEIAGSYLYSQNVWGPRTDADSNISNNINAEKISIMSITLPINPLLPLTDFEIRNGIAYVSTDSAKSSDPDLFVIDIHDINNPVILSSIDTGPGISAITLAGRRIFAAAASTAYQLHIIYLNNLNSIFLESRFKLPLPFATATPSFGSSIFYKGGLIYLGTEKWDDDEFSVIDVNNPISPVKIGGFETNSKINDIYIRDKLAYVADSDFKQMRIIDLNDILNPVEFNSFSPSGGNRQEGKSISLFENGLSLTRTSGGFDIVFDHEIFAFATTSSTTLARFNSYNIPGGAYSIVTDRSYLYLITREIDKEFRIFDREHETDLNIAFSLPVAPQTITCDNDQLYILAHSAPVIYQISFH